MSMTLAQAMQETGRAKLRGWQVQKVLLTLRVADVEEAGW